MTIKEVKKHFKNAKEVESVYRGSLFKIKGNYHWYDNSVFCADTEGIERSLWDAEKGFAKITKYKSKQIKVSEELVKGYHKDACQEFKTRIEKDFPKLFPKTGLEVGKWYKSEEYSLLFNLQSESGKVKSYGFASNGWYNDTKENTYWGYHSDLKSSKVTPATDQEVKDALMKEAVKRGFKKGVKFNHNEDEYPQFKGEVEEIGSDKYSLGSGYRLLLDGWTIFRNGKWATIIEPPKEIQHEGNTYVLKDE